MGEQVVFTGEGRPVKPTLKDWAKKTFTAEGNEVAWRQKHAKELEEMKAINAALPPEDRAKAMEKLDQRIKSSAKLRVVGNYVGSILAPIFLGLVGSRIKKRLHK